MTTTADTTTADTTNADTTTIDPITFEVIRHRLLAITDEQGATLAAISGSTHVVEASDYNVGLYLPDGSVAAMGRTILSHASSMAAITRSVIEDCGRSPGINPGDMFIVNDPWKGTVHAQDVGLVAPIYYRGELLAWTGAMCHMVDVGGMTPGSFCIDATDSYQEGLQMPPTKLVDGGEVRTDVWNLILGHTRMAPTVNLDLRALIGANNTAVRAMTALADKYGARTVRTVMANLIELSERRLRNRLALLPDARLHSKAFLDNDGGLARSSENATYEVDLVLTKRGDTLSFDFSASSPQVDGYVNCAYSGLMAGIAAALLPTLAFDAPWNEGLFKPVEVTCPDGLICNAARPAAVSGGALEAGWLVEMTATECLSKLAACSDGLLREAQATPAGGPDKFVLTGAGDNGARQTYVIMDCLATGGAAYAHRDGAWTQGQHNIERQKISNVEAVEMDSPLLYLWRGLVADSGGAGRNRGGMSMGAVYTVHGGRDVTALNSAHGWEVPNSYGIFGGYPGAQNTRTVVHGSDVRARLAAGTIPSVDELSGDRPVMRGRQGLYHLGDDDVLATVPQAGGGWGDPLDRPAAALQDDLDFGAVTPEAAVRVYGAVLTGDGRIDAAATETSRAAVRARRRNLPAELPLPEAPAGPRVRVHPMGDGLDIVEAGGARWVACACGCVIAPADEPWRARAALETSRDVHAFGHATRLDEGLELRRYACPGCGSLKATDVVRVGAPHPDDIRLLTADTSGEA
ncbi:hydantoinase B/oxoprolinase family protein [Actinocorallia sp. A-T 12471]|uniref:hydantoinase B/oxoprolinase family protein n=1 Tax=Actinocorallia sp. A-T 12471 TaxID=3089813 RepID=UPI0029CDC98E|nr:hydantoinase B/oxoprolinase family protein [Actinocorallia sp. A-T 12471]MDX6740577.1 hydantoinase B/oxoprolinase family protein [Actinocorallia sp. A-T 12471]